MPTTDAEIDSNVQKTWRVTSNGRCLIASQMREVGFSGNQIHAVAVRELFRRAGWATEIITPFSGHALLRNAAFALRYLARPFSRQTAIFWYRYGHNLYLRSALKDALLRDPGGAVIYAQDTLSAQSALAVRRPGKDKVVLVVHFNDSQAEEWAVRGEILRGGWLYRQIEELEFAILPQVDELIFVSDYMRGRLQARIPALAHVPAIIIPNFVEVPTPAPDAKKGDLLSIGTLEPRKNQAYTLHVLAELHRRQLPLTATFLGGGEDKQHLELLARELGLENYVHFAGYVSNAAGWLPHHTLLVHAAHMENCPISLIEALAASIPVAAAAVGGIPELVDASTGVVLDLESPENGAAEILALLNDSVRLSEAKKEGRRRYDQMFSPQSAGSRLIANFSRLLNLDGQNA